MSDRANSGWQIKDNEDEKTASRLSQLFPIPNAKQNIELTTSSMPGLLFQRGADKQHPGSESF